MKATFENYRITATYTGQKVAPWDNGCENWNHHRVTVYNKDTKKRTCFDFWASIAKPELRSKYDVLNAFHCFVSDAISGGETFEDFCSEFGYDTDSRRAHKTWKACQKSNEKLERIGVDDVYALADKLGERYA